VVNIKVSPNVIIYLLSKFHIFWRPIAIYFIFYSVLNGKYLTEIRKIFFFLTGWARKPDPHHPFTHDPRNTTWQLLLSLRGPTHQGKNFPPNRVRAPPLLASQPRALRESRRSHTASIQSLAPDPYPAHVACPGTACCATPPSPESRLPVACCVAKAT
jgi:hypothetical protein